MRFKNIIHFFVFISLFYNCNQTEIANNPTQIIPVPSNQSITEGQFVLNHLTGIDYGEDFKVSAQFLKSFIEDGSPIELQQNTMISFIKDT
jgi:hexosaminidase